MSVTGGRDRLGAAGRATASTCTTTERTPKTAWSLTPTGGDHLSVPCHRRDAFHDAPLRAIATPLSLGHALFYFACCCCEKRAPPDRTFRKFPLFSNVHRHAVIGHVLCTLCDAHSILLHTTHMMHRIHYLLYNMYGYMLLWSKFAQLARERTACHSLLLCTINVVSTHDPANGF